MPSPKAVRTHSTSSRLRAGLRFFFEHLHPDVLVERQIGHQVLQLRVLFAQLRQLPGLGAAQVRVLLFPNKKSCLADAHLPTHIRHRGAAIDLPQRAGNLPVSEPRSLHRPLLPRPDWPLHGGLAKPLYSSSKLPSKSGPRTLMPRVLVHSQIRAGGGIGGAQQTVHSADVRADGRPATGGP